MSEKFRDVSNNVARAKNSYEIYFLRFLVIFLAGALLFIFHMSHRSSDLPINSPDSDISISAPEALDKIVENSDVYTTKTKLSTKKFEKNNLVTEMEQFYEFVDANTAPFIQDLRSIVAIKSVSGDPAYSGELHKMADWLKTKMLSLGASVEVRQNPRGANLAPIVLGKLGNDPNKKNLLVYGHYDVQPALKEDGWATEPFELVEKDGKLYGRGSTDDKAPVLAWLLTIQSLQQLGQPIPVNLIFCFEGMEESGSEGLEELIIAEAQKYFKDADCVCISDNYWLGKNKPCLTYGLRGVSYFSVTVSGPGKDLHSGIFGGSVHEPMTDLSILFSKLVNPKGEILIPGIMDDVQPVTRRELESIDQLDFNMADFVESIGANVTVYDTKRETLMHRWRFPSLSLHGIEGAFYGKGAKTVIPAKVIGKFSIRTVPFQDPAKISQLVKDYINAEFEKLNSKNTCEVNDHHAGKSWLSDIDHWNYRAGAAAIKEVFGVEPDYTREGGSIPITLVFQDALNRNVMLLPVGASDDGAHSINEKINISNFLNGIKLMAAYMRHLADAE